MIEIKLTTDWIFLHNGEVIFYPNDFECCVNIYDNYQYHLAELALKSMNVKYDCLELYLESDVDYEKPYHCFMFEDIEEIKESCPELYNEFQTQIQNHNKKEEAAEKKEDLILEFIETPRTFEEIHELLDKEYYQKEVYSYTGWENDFEKHNEFNLLCTKEFLNGLIDDGLVCLKAKKYAQT